MIEPGDVILVFKKYLSGIEHDKFAICVAPEYFFFFYINSKPWNKALEAQIKIIGKLELPCLTHTSYIDTSTIHKIPREAIIAAINARKVWRAPFPLCQRLAKSIQDNRYLPRKYKKIILKNFKNYL